MQTGQRPIIRQKWLGHVATDGRPITHEEYQEHLKLLIEGADQAGDIQNRDALVLALRALPSEGDCEVCKTVRTSQFIAEHMRKR